MKTPSPKAEFWDAVDPYYNKEKDADFVHEVRDDIRQRVNALVNKAKKGV